MLEDDKKKTDMVIESKTSLVLGSLLAAGFIVCYYTTFQWLNYKFSTPDSYYSHGYLIPFIVLYLIYDKKEVLKGLQISSNITGLLVILFALALHVVGVVSSIHFISGFSIIFYCLGCSLYLLGTAYTKYLLFPLTYLVLMMPLPDEYLGTIALPLKSAATWFALKLVELINVPYLREGFSILLANTTFIVGTPCSGMRSLISFLGLGILFLYYMRLSFIKAIFVLALIPIMSVILNGARIFILMLIAMNFGQKAAAPESFLHDASGLFVFIIGLAFMIFIFKVIYEKKSS